MFSVLFSSCLGQHGNADDRYVSEVESNPLAMLNPFFFILTLILYYETHIQTPYKDKRRTISIFSQPKIPQAPKISGQDICQLHSPQPLLLPSPFLQYFCNRLSLIRVLIYPALKLVLVVIFDMFLSFFTFSVGVCATVTLCLCS